MIPLGVVASSKVVIPAIDVFMWTAGMNLWPRNGGSVDYSTNILVESGNTYSINLSVDGSPGIKRARLKNDTTSTTLAITADNETTYSENGTAISGGQGQSPIIETIFAGTVVGFMAENPSEMVTLAADLEVDSGGWGAGWSGPISYQQSPGFYNPDGTAAPFWATIIAGWGGDGVENPYSAIFGPTYVCAGGVGAFYGSDFTGNGTSGTVFVSSSSFTDIAFANCFYSTTGANVPNTYSGSGATTMNSAQVGTNAGLGAAIIKSNVPLTVSSASNIVDNGHYYYYCTSNVTFQIT